MYRRRRIVVDVDAVGDAAAGQGGPQRRGEADGVFGVAEPVPGDQPRVVVDEREQVRFAAADDGPVQGVAGRQLVGAGCLELAEDRRRAAVWPGEEFQADEMALQGPLGRRPASARAQDPATWAAVPAGFSAFSAAARASTSAGVRGVTWRAGGISASTRPPARHGSTGPGWAATP